MGGRRGEEEGREGGGGGQGLCVGLDLSLLEVVGAGLKTCEEVGVVKRVHTLFWRSAQARHGPHCSGRSAGGSAGDTGR